MNSLIIPVGISNTRKVLFVGNFFSFRSLPWTSFSSVFQCFHCWLLCSLCISSFYESSSGLCFWMLISNKLLNSTDVSFVRFHLETHEAVGVFWPFALLCLLRITSHFSFYSNKAALASPLFHHSHILQVDCLYSWIPFVKEMFLVSLPPSSISRLCPVETPLE